ncbi:hypothetical protein BJ138DRAFT_1220943 [Hygrophoropsis aurantiaca]|uniref:Uncharacterized protein n=1 Tax=Hygrophoropsis aurantiaca TaxID=72124 RepID=A0ACB7ZZ72_9AGAM|nr:hypothetical protein BJ138DRAFT_1220943 [Hygrophoropsis aurantiaca]
MQAVTFTVRELEAALELVKAQNIIFAAHDQDLASAPDLLPANELNCGVCGIKIETTDTEIKDKSADDFKESLNVGANDLQVVESEDAQLAADITLATQLAAESDPASAEDSQMVEEFLPSNLYAPVASRSQWYAVTVGRKVGVLEGWHNTHGRVVGVPGGCYLCHSSQEGAQLAFDEALNAGTVNEVIA